MRAPWIYLRCSGRWQAYTDEEHQRQASLDVCRNTSSRCPGGSLDLPGAVPAFVRTPADGGGSVLLVRNTMMHSAAGKPPRLRAARPDRLCGPIRLSLRTHLPRVPALRICSQHRRLEVVCTAARGYYIGLDFGTSGSRAAVVDGAISDADQHSKWSLVVGVLCYTCVLFSLILPAVFGCTWVVPGVEHSVSAY